MTLGPPFAGQQAAADPSPVPSSPAIRFEIPGEPHAQARQRHRIVRLPGREYVQNYQPAESRNWKSVAQDHFRAGMIAAGLRPFDGPVRLLIIAYFSCPRSQWRKRDPQPERASTNARDWDNLGKAVADAGNGVLYLDDRQVVDGRVVKRVAAQGEPARVVVEIEPWRD